MKVWRDCLHCEKYFQCDEKTMVIDLTGLSDAKVASRAEAAEVPA